MENALSILISQAIERRYGHKPNKRQVARDCGIAYHSLIAVQTGHVKRPAEEIIEGLAVGLDLNYDDLALAAYGRMPKYFAEKSDSLQNEAPPPETNDGGECRTTGRPLESATSSTS